MTDMRHMKKSSGMLPTLFMAVAAGAGALLARPAAAVPLYARQTGQNCLACHAGGQFPELTPFGRKFKLTGYTMGSRLDLPLAAMAVASVARVSSTAGSQQPAVDFPRNGDPELSTLSVFCCGKITDNIGTFIQWTYDVYDRQDDSGAWRGKSHIDQVDVRYADHLTGNHGDLIYGVTFNNNPGESDVWNTFNSAFTPVPTYTPVANALASTVPFDVPAAPFDQALGQLSAGVTTYAYWNDTVYAEAGLYRSATGIFSVLGETPADPFSRLSGTSTYWRLALNHDWSAHSAMIGVHGMSSEAWFDPSDRASPTATFTDYGVDSQYQYLLDPHVVTVMMSYTHERQHNADALWDATNPGYVGAFANQASNLGYWRAKGTYSYQARYGASLAYTAVNGSADALAYGGNASNRPDSRLWIPEIFYQPVQYLRIGLQYYKWDKYLGVSRNYDPQGLAGRNASDNNAFFLYVWGAR
jgi:hypothetical protein